MRSVVETHDLNPEATVGHKARVVQVTMNAQSFSRGASNRT